MTLTDWYDMLPMILFSIGITYVITGSKIGYPIRFTVCFALYHLKLRYFWSLVTCPPCNAWWSAGFIALFFGYPILQVLQLAFTTCGIMAVIQAFLGGDGIAAAEDFEAAFKG